MNQRHLLKIRSICLLFLLAIFSTNITFAGYADQAPSAFNSNFYSIDVNGVQRDLLFHLPANYVQGSRLPVLFSFHGYGSNGASQEVISGMSELADQYGFIVIYPEGLKDAAGFQLWNTHELQDQQTDLDFVNETLRLLKLFYGYEPTRVYATGFSNGGGFANLLALKMSDTFAAISSVAGAYYNNDAYTPNRPVPVMAFHGTADEVVPYEGFLVLPAIMDWANGWAHLNGCASNADVFFSAGEILAERWSTGCSAPVELITIHGKGHAWPGSAMSPDITSNQVNASQEMLEFFARHPLR